NGDPAKVLDPEAVTLLVSACGGIPRQLNRAAGLAFELTAQAEAEIVDVEAAMESLSRLGIAVPEEAETSGAVLLPHPARSAESGGGRKEKQAEANERATGRGSKERASRNGSACY